MDDFFKAIGVVVSALLIVCVGAAIGGTIIWIIWPICIPFVFPKLVQDGILCFEIGWAQAVFFTWIANILFKSTVSSSK